MQKQKKYLLIAIPVLIVLGLIISAVALLANRGGEEPAPEPEPTRRPAEVLNQLPVGERPYVVLTPQADGRNVTLSVVALNKPASMAKYELEYQAGTLLQGAFGDIELTEVPQSKTILFGSCSAGGACTYHTDIKGGSLLTRMVGDSTDALKADWRYFDNAARESQVASKDAKFQLESDQLARQRFIIVFNGFGYPEGLEGTPVSDPYSLQTSAELSGTGQLTLRAQEEDNLQVAVWDGSEWSYIDGSVDGKSITAEVPLAELYVAVQSPAE